MEAEWESVTIAVKKKKKAEECNILIRSKDMNWYKDLLLVYINIKYWYFVNNPARTLGRLTSLLDY